jgi:hypothetical protein
MKFVAYGLLLVALSSAARAQSTTAQSELEQAGLAGRVKSVEVGRIEYVLRDGRSVEGRRITASKTTYDEQGRKAEEVWYDQHRSPSGRAVYTHDAAGRMVGYNVYNSDGTGASRFTYAYDAGGNKTEEASYNWNGPRTSRLVYTYDARGQMLTQTSYLADDSVSWKNVNVYDSEGRKTESAQYHGETLRYRFFYKYEGKGRLKEQETREFNVVPNLRSSHAPVPGKVAYTYDDEKRMKEVATYDERGTLKSRLVYFTDEKGNDAGVLELNADGSFKSRAIQWYEQNVLLRTLSGAPSVEFVYDARGNWTRQTFLIKPADAERPEPYGAEYREIIYY